MNNSNESTEKISNHKKKTNEFKEKEKLIPCIKVLSKMLEKQIKSELAEKNKLVEQLKREKENLNRHSQ